MKPTMLRDFARAARGYEPTWRYAFNLAPTLAYKLRAPTLTGEAARVLTCLNRDGMAITRAQTLLSDAMCYEELADTVGRLEAEHAARLAAARAEANDATAVGRKTFIYELLGARPVLEPQSVFARFALQPTILQIVNEYFGMYTRLRHYNVWHTFATQAEARESQLWHRDREDHFILKVFVYLSDVDDAAGPFTYAAGSHPKGHSRREPAAFLEGVVKRSDDAQMAEVVPPARWLKGTGPRGTIIFADTRGYHKGGLARQHDRLMYTSMFTSQASPARQLFELPQQLALPGDRAQRFALMSAPAH